jgi:electron transfer flavoprotein alpha/beta subunit
MAATRKTPTIWGIGDLALDASALEPRLKILDLYIPEKVSQVEIISGDDDADAGRKLALKLREEKII